MTTGRTVWASVAAAIYISPVEPGMMSEAGQWFPHARILSTHDGQFLAANAQLPI